MWIVKLGGSLLGRPELKAWLSVLASRSDGRVVIVPGGGVFADAVRDAQQAGGYDDAAAHHMALLAMEQYALVLQSLQPDLVTASSELEIAERSWQHRAILWMPSRMVLADETIAKSWDVTSDSLAAWLAAKLNASRLVLVKHQGLDERPLPIAQLVQSGIVDAAFEGFLQRLNCAVDVVGLQDSEAFAVALSSRPQPTRAN